MCAVKNKLLDGRYVPIKEIGSGSFSTVWLVFDLNTVKYCALKIQNTEDYDDALYEISVYNAIENIKSDNLMKLYRSFEYEDSDDDEDDKPHICMALDIMNCSTHDLIKFQYKKGLPFFAVMEITKQVLMGLNKLHQNNVIHKDVKPENILISNYVDKYEELKSVVGAESLVKKNGVTNKKNKDKVIKEIFARVDKFLEGMQGNSDNEENSDENNDEEYILSESSSESSIEQMEINENIHMFENIHAKLADMGHCVLPHTNFPYQTQSNYYLAPELILHIDYNFSVDIWALGCSIYELLTGNILFDSESYGGNTYRHHLYMIAEKLGMFPQSWIEECELKDVFFNKRNTCIKGYRGIKFQRPLWKELQLICKNNNLTDELGTYFVDFMMGLFRYDVNSRFTAQIALDHKIFKLIENIVV